MSSSPRPGRQAQTHPAPGHSSGSRKTVPAPDALPAAIVIAPIAASRTLVEADAARALLERIIQRIFTVGLLLHAAPGDGRAARDPEPALNELDGVLSDIRATVLSWRPARPGHRRDHEPTDELGTAISHLNVVAEIVRGLTVSYAARGDRTQWAATTDADHAVHRALLMLQHISRDRASCEPDRLAREPGVETQG